jgi:hypothetical protein
VLTDLFEFAGVSRMDEALAYAARTVRPERADAWKEQLSVKLLDTVRPYMEETLEGIGYQW